MSVNGFSIFHVSKQNVAGQCITRDHEKHEHDNKETFVDRHDDSLDKHRKRWMFPWKNSWRLDKTFGRDLELNFYPSFDFATH